MQNQLPYPQSFPTQPFSSGPNTQKFLHPALHKPFDKTPPSLAIKHIVTTPNHSLDFPHPKSSMIDANTQSPGLKRNMEFRTPPSHVQHGFPQSQPAPRSLRNEMTKSLIMVDTNNIEIPQEMPKKEGFKNIQRRQVRMSESIDDMPGGMFGPKKEEISLESTKESSREANFYKKDSFEEKQKVQGRQVPSFLARQRGNSDMKRSQVVDPVFEQNRLNLARQFARKSVSQIRKVKVDDFIRVKQLGNGKYGRVYLVVEKFSGFICALKVIEKKLLHEQEITDQFIRQVKIQMFLNHPNIIKMYGCFDDIANIYIILEVGTGGQLYHQLKKSQPLSEPRIAFIMRQVCEAVNEIHSLKVIHRDIKPENIVLHDNIIKLCDFGWSVYQDNKLRTTFCGTPLYVCPQILKGKEYDQKIDIWSIGIMMYQMVVGENPFKITREEQLIKIVKDQIKIPSYLFVSGEVRDFLDRCLQKNPGERASIKELMNHQLFKKNQEKNEKKMINM